jgi:hypothetical protein
MARSWKDGYLDGSTSDKDRRARLRASFAERKSALSRNIIKADGALAKSLTREDIGLLFADPD